MSLLKLYPANERLFDNNGLMNLEPISAIVHEEDNGEFYVDIKLTLKDGGHVNKDNIILANTLNGYQPFRVGNPDIDVYFKAKCYHISYDLNNYILGNVAPTNLLIHNALMWCKGKTDTPIPFDVFSDVDMKISARYVRKTMLEVIFDMAERCGGHIVRDYYKVSILTNIGVDKGSRISYGVNMTYASVIENWDAVVTKLLPVGYDGLLLDDPYMYADVTYDLPYTKTISFSKPDDIDSDDIGNLKLNLREQAKRYLEENKYPKVNYTYEAYNPDISFIGDTVYVNDKKRNVNLKTNVISYDYDAVANKILSTEFGNYKKKFGNILQDIQVSIDTIKKENEAVFEDTKKHMQNLINNLYKYGHVYITDQEIYILDKLPKESARFVIRLNLGGIGFSQMGWEGPYISAWTIDGKFNADFITAGTLKAIRILGCEIFGSKFISTSTDGSQSVEIKEGFIHLFDLISSTSSLSLGNNQIRFYDWKDKGNYVGSIGSLHDLNTNRSFVGLWCDEGDCIVIGCKKASNVAVTPAFYFDANTMGSSTPYIINTCSGPLHINGGTIEVENGLIKNWELPGTTSGYFFSQNGGKITVTNGLITGIEV